MSPDFAGALDFIGGFKTFEECPEFDFEQCWWRFTAFRTGQSFMDSNAEYVHRCFDAHAGNFSSGIRELLEANSRLQPVQLRLLPQPVANRSSPAPSASERKRLAASGRSVESEAEPISTSVGTTRPFKYDVAFSFAGSDREFVEHIANRTRDAGFKVFYDNFYPEQLWGEDLVAKFDRIYRLESRFCVVFLSSEYAQKMWTTHERRSATGRALEEKGAAYILPVYVEAVEIDGLPPSLGRLSLTDRTSDDVADLLIAKLKNAVV